METPDANETSIALENYRRVSINAISAFVLNTSPRPVIMAVGLCFSLLQEARYLRVLILITIMAVLSLCSGERFNLSCLAVWFLTVQ